MPATNNRISSRKWTRAARPSIVHAALLVSAAALAVVAFGCCDSDPVYPVEAEDLDMGTIMSLVKESKVENAEQLEEAINNEKTGINNVDADGDDKIDYIVVREEKEGKTTNFELLAVPSSEPTKEPDLVGNLSFTPEGDKVKVEGGHPDYVHGHRQHYYSHHHHGGGGLFFLWMATSGRTRYYPSHNSGYYSRYNRKVTPRGSAIAGKRASYGKKMKVSPVAKKAAPSSWRVKSARAQKTRSRFAKSPRKSFSSSRKSSVRGGGGKSRGGGGRSFGK